ncbi:hypothetical protein [Thalassobacillus devorans]|nr:hypothetical protein [Thalassobacillus devorans]
MPTQESLPINYEVDRMINEGLGGGLIRSEYEACRFDPKGKEEEL